MTSWPSPPPSPPAPWPSPPAPPPSPPSRFVKLGSGYCLDAAGKNPWSKWYSYCAASLAECQYSCMDRGMREEQWHGNWPCACVSYTEHPGNFNFCHKLGVGRCILAIDGHNANKSSCSTEACDNYTAAFTSYAYIDHHGWNEPQDTPPAPPCAYRDLWSAGREIPLARCSPPPSSPPPPPQPIDTLTYVVPAALGLVGLVCCLASMCALARYRRRRPTSEMALPLAADACLAADALRELEPMPSPLLAYPQLKDGLALETRVGEGGYATVWRGRMRGSPVAFKVFRPRGSRSSRDVDRIVAKEVAMLNQVRHPSICAYFGVCYVAGAPAIVLEYMAGGSLLDFLDISRRPTPDNESHRGSASTSASPSPAECGAAFTRPASRTRLLLSLAHQVGSGLAFLHSRGIVHRDIKCSNVLLDASRTFAKVSDFGLAHVLARREGDAADHQTPTELRYGAQLGTLRYLAPECHPGVRPRGEASTTADGGPRASPTHSEPPIAADNGPTDGGESDTGLSSTLALIARDVYSWACLLFELVHEETYFAGVPSLEVFFCAFSGTRPPLGLPSELDEVAELIRVGWHSEPERRGTIEAACAVLEQLARRHGASAEFVVSAPSEEETTMETTNTTSHQLRQPAQHGINEDRSATAKLGAGASWAPAEEVAEYER